MALDNRTCFTVNLRDALACRRCGKRPARKAGYHRGFEYHHLRPSSQGGPDEVENLLLLCHGCHTRVHQGKVDLPAGLDLAPPAAFPCDHCGILLDPAAVEMNCGWYRCDRCGEKTHLFDHHHLGG